MARAITGNGRYYIQLMANYIEKGLQELLPSSKPYIVYGDTDSCLGSTIVNTNIGEQSIESLYEVLNGCVEVRSENNFVKHVKDSVNVSSLNNKLELENKPIKYVMKHKVKKRMFKIKCNGDSVTITEDHSMIVLRDKSLVEVKPKDVKKTDKLIKIIKK